MTTPRDAGLCMPAEWRAHAATWLAWPSAADLWREDLEPARRAFAELVAAIAAGETAEVLVPNDREERSARAALPEAGVRFHRVAFGDIWLRDTAPIFLVRRDGPSAPGATVRFAFNGWGGKYVLDGDAEVAERIASRVDLPSYVQPFVLEGGAVEVDGEGTLLTTRQCLLNRNRNGAVAEDQVESLLRGSLGVERIVWLEEGLQNDHTDGHVDTLARFVRPGVVVAMEPRRDDDPNRQVLAAILRDLEKARDAHGHALEVARIPSPGAVLDAGGRLMPASYANFYVSNAAVVVPTYGAPFDEEAVAGIAALFPGRRTLGVDARAILTGGGAFHCITQQQPRAAP